MYLDPWIAEKINMDKGASLTRVALDQYMEEKRMELLAFLMEKSPFYQTRLADYTPFALEDWDKIPFTYAADIVNEGAKMICVHPGEISRIVTQTTSGTTGTPKRIYFTPEDQELTIDYFHYGMKIMVSPGDTVLILLPHKSPGSLGFLLQEGLSRLGAQGVFTDTLEQEKCDSLKYTEITAIVGPPTLISNLAETKPEMHPHSVLMTADFVPEEARKIVKTQWGSKVFEHYGTTEMGLGCAMSCRAVNENPPVGYHIRENDLYIEIIDPASGRVLPKGEWGEIVMTTLTRKGMPLLRYRTGDTGRLLNEPCYCGSSLNRLDRVPKRMEGKKLNL